ncbi:MAG: hypothetical protein HW387_293 [Parachlamydiales bacterium]|nr:hypothetical protein [Parachlamydiales bacterium]
MCEETGLQIIIQSLIDFQPKDAIEARLVVQAIVAHAYAMNGSRVSGNSDMLCHIEAMTNLSIKLMRIHNETIETLARYRRGGTQQVIVQHQSNVMSDKTVVNHIGVGVFTQNQGDSPCPQGNAEPKREPTTINHVDNPPWPMDDADYMEEKVLEPKQLQD